MLLTLLKNKGSLMVPGQGEWFYVEPLTFVFILTRGSL